MDLIHSLLETVFGFKHFATLQVDIEPPLHILHEKMYQLAYLLENYKLYWCWQANDIYFPDLSMAAVATGVAYT